MNVLSSPDEGLHNNDVALLKLSRKILFNEFVLPACLPFEIAKDHTDMDCIVSGWGQINGNRAFNSRDCFIELRFGP